MLRQTRRPPGPIEPVSVLQGRRGQRQSGAAPATSFLQTSFVSSSGRVQARHCVANGQVAAWRGRKLNAMMTRLRRRYAVCGFVVVSIFLVSRLWKRSRRAAGSPSPPCVRNCARCCKRPAAPARQKWCRCWPMSRSIAARRRAGNWPLYLIRIAGNRVAADDREARRLVGAASAAPPPGVIAGTIRRYLRSWFADFPDGSLAMRAAVG